tara:strand:+ start:493 stop:651 length:159 start_codon:yes stop_codon:yes gene_type:complete
MKMKNILSLKETLPCIRTLKIATVLSEKKLNLLNIPVIKIFFTIRKLINTVL